MKTITRIVLRIEYSANPPDRVGDQELFYVALHIIKKAHKARHMTEFRRWHGVFTPHRRKTRRQKKLYPTIPAISRRKGGAQPPAKSHK